MPVSSASMSGSSLGSISTTVTFVPKRWYTLPSSMPMTPPPMTSMLSGTWSSVSAPVESMQALESFTPGMGGVMGWEPVAIMTLPAVSVFPPTLTALAPVNTASPFTTLILFARMSAATPPVSRSLTLWRFACTFAQSTATSRPMIPIFSECVASS